MNSGPVPFALQKRMRLAAQRALSWTPRESSVWVSTLPAPAWRREASWPRRGELAGGPGSTDCQTPPLPADRDECSDGPRPCSHSCRNAPGRFSCSCPAGFTLARDERTCRGERAPGGRGLLGTWPKCTQGDFGLGPWAGSTPLRECELRGSIALFSWKTCCFEGLGAGRLKYLGVRGLLKDIHVLTARTPPEKPSRPSAGISSQLEVS